jgi:thiamine biosynthesis lipoprotein
MKTVYFLILGWLVAGLSACHPKLDLIKKESYVFGTRVEITLYTEDTAAATAALNAALAELDRWQIQWHAWQGNGEVRQLNAALQQGWPHPLSAEGVLVDDMLRRAQPLERLSNGFFSPAIGQIVAAWGFHSDTYAATIPSAQAQLAMQTWRPSLQNLHFSTDQQGRTVVNSNNRQVVLDFGGMAKGYALDRVSERLQAADIRHALINIGGNLLALGNKPSGQPWQVGIQAPRGASAMAYFPLYDGEAIGTSGDYQRYFEVDGVRYCHLINPKTAAPDCHNQSASVLIPRQKNAGLLSDVATKPVYFSSAKTAATYRQPFGHADMLMVDGAGEVWISSAWANKIHWTEDFLSGDLSNGKRPVIHLF